MRCSVFFFFNDTATTEIYTLSLHDALPICCSVLCVCPCSNCTVFAGDNGRSPRVCKGPNRGGRCGRDSRDFRSSARCEENGNRCDWVLSLLESSARHLYVDRHGKRLPCCKARRRLPGSGPPAKHRYSVGNWEC